MNAARTWLLAAAALALVSTGCVDERSFYIAGNLAECIEPSTSGGGAGGEGTNYLAAGVLDIDDLGPGAGYYLFPDIRNEMLVTATVDMEPERNRLVLRRFEVELDLQGIETTGIPGQLLKFSTLATGLIEPQGSLRVSGLQVVPDALVPFLQARIPALGRLALIAKIKAVADHNGADLKSVEYEYPIQICKGCLLAVECHDTRPTDVVFANSCRLPQDAATTCCKKPNKPWICYTVEDLEGLPPAT